MKTAIHWVAPTRSGEAVASMRPHPIRATPHGTSAITRHKLRALAWLIAATPAGAFAQQAPAQAAPTQAASTQAAPAQQPAPSAAPARPATSAESEINAGTLPTVQVQAPASPGAVDNINDPDQITGVSKTGTPIKNLPLSVQVIPAGLLQEQGATMLRQGLSNASGVNVGGQDF